MILVEHLTRRFGPKVAVDDLNLDIPAGTFFCFLGPNGAGKTTTIRILTGLLRPSAGRAILGGHDIQKEPILARRLIGYVPDHPFLYDKLTGREFMRFVAGLYRMDEKDFHERCLPLMELFEIAAVADQLIEDYSHGMRQKLSFASCFLHDPKIMIVDEPWVGLDPKNIRFVKDYLRQKCREEGLTVFMSTHTLSIAEEVADQIGIIHHGKLRFVGTVSEVKSLSHTPGSLEDVFLEITREDEA
ncbi:MAG TPA: ABC transporter ATP-binding protein [Candidatus Hydrogenedentes bacterium]|nr:ABC transporter ATP-binding protein [Candidatus Hydrogenedentota bacterium]HOV61454.1 ABC transporter ATP-binding protein [Candidatus Hydrogenedentota bacterium]